MNDREIAESINAQEFDHCFILHPDGTIEDAHGDYAPEVIHDPDGDVDMCGWNEWSCITGLTGQDSYHGAVMHPSEYIGVGVARVMLEMVEDGPLLFALTVVTDIDTEEGEDDAVGWAICYRDIP